MSVETFRAFSVVEAFLLTYLVVRFWPKRQAGPGGVRLWPTHFPKLAERFAPTGLKAWARKTLGMSGVPASRLDAATRAFLLWWGGLALGLPVLAAVAGLPPKTIGAGFLLGFFLPRFWLLRRASAWQTAFQRDLPDAMDLMAGVAEAGLSLNATMSRVAEQFPPPVGQEIAAMVEESQRTSRREAMESLVARVPIEEVRIFTRTIARGEDLGVGVADSLRVLADDITDMAYRKKEEAGGKLPVLMLLPTMLFIFPALFLVIIAAVAHSFIGLTL